MPDTSLKITGTGEVELTVASRFNTRAFKARSLLQRPEMLETCSKIKKVYGGTGYLHISGR